MRHLSRHARTPVGLTMGARSINAVQLEHVGKTGVPVLAAAAVVPRRRPGAPPDADEVARIAEAMERQGFRGRSVVIAAPCERVLSGVLEVPPRSSGAPLDQIVRNELARTSRVDPSQLECGWWELPRGLREQEGSQVIALGCRHEDAARLLGPCEEAGLDVRAIDAPGPALARAVGRLLPAGDEITGVLEIGTAAALFIVIRGRTVVYERLLAEGGLGVTLDQLEKRLAVDRETAEHVLEGVGIDGAPPSLADEVELLNDARSFLTERTDELAAEVRASASYAGRRYGQEMSRLLLSGEGAGMPGLSARFSRRLECESSVVSPSSLFEVGSTGRLFGASANPAATLAAGLALHEEEGR
ncbi:MAG: pilus assembly protein PilM [Phycisphaerales bacterium]